MRSKLIRKIKIKKTVNPIENWPKLYHDILKVKDPSSHVGICTLWTERGIVEKIVKVDIYDPFSGDDGDGKIPQNKLDEKKAKCGHIPKKLGK